MIRNINYWAYDISENCINDGEVSDVDAINQSIATILGTYYGERFDNIEFGSGLPLYLFSSLDEINSENIKTMVINSLKTWEDRIVIDESNTQVVYNYDSQTIAIYIPYTIKITGQTSTFISNLSGGL